MQTLFNPVTGQYKGGEKMTSLTTKKGAIQGVWNPLFSD
jgi:hypothetical protein